MTTTCPICTSRKGKRPCKAHGAPVCSACCGTSRSPEACAGCSFFKTPARKYDSLPRFSTQQMEGSELLGEISFPVEAAMCSLDRERRFTMRDAEAIEIVEVLLDLYAFGDSPKAVAPRVAALGCQSVVDLVQRELARQDREVVAKVLGAVRFVARRRACSAWHHLDVLHQLVGSFVSPGVGLRRLDDGTDLAVGGL
jgi:hypothetical protein